MADPVLKTCTAGDWVEVATNVTSGVIYKQLLSPSLYKLTYVDTGNPAPTTDEKAILAFGSCRSEIISRSAGTDIYIKAVKNDGEVLVDAT